MPWDEFSQRIETSSFSILVILVESLSSPGKVLGFGVGGGVQPNVVPDATRDTWFGS